MIRYGIGDKQTPWFYEGNIDQNTKILERMNIDDLIALASRKRKGIKPLLVEFLKNKV